MNRFLSEENVEEQLRISLTNALKQRQVNMDQKEKDNLAENYKIFCEYLDRQRLSRMMNSQCCPPLQSNEIDLSKIVEQEVQKKVKENYNSLNFDFSEAIQQQVKQQLGQQSKKEETHQEYKEIVFDFLSEVHGKLDIISRDMTSGDEDRKSKAFFNFGSIMHEIYDFLEDLEQDE